jgi:hypothetical protein
VNRYNRLFASTLIAGVLVTTTACAKSSATLIFTSDISVSSAKEIDGAQCSQRVAHEIEATLRSLRISDMFYPGRLSRVDKPYREISAAQGSDLVVQVKRDTPVPWDTSPRPTIENLVLQRGWWPLTPRPGADVTTIWIGIRPTGVRHVEPDSVIYGAMEVRDDPFQLARSACVRQ